MAKSVYDIIKRQNGEKFARTIRNFDSGIFEIENLPEIVKYAGKDATELLTYLSSLKPQGEKTESDFSQGEDLFQLAHKAGYNVIYADTLEKQNSIQHFFKQGEELCTFRDPNRFKKYHILHFIKEGAEELNRADFIGKEDRGDEYGTSVISIQVAKEGGFIKICNRYNHTVQNPDYTFEGNPDNIIEGMTLAIEKFLCQKVGAIEVPLSSGYLQLDKKIYHYHLEEDNIYYGNGFYIKDHKVYPIDKDYQLIVDSFLIDFKKNEIKTLHGDDNSIRQDVFFHAVYNHIPLIQEEIKGGRLSHRKEGDLDAIYVDDHLFLKAKRGVLTFIHLRKPTKTDYGIFRYHDGIEEIYLDNMIHMPVEYDHNSFFSCPNLKILSLPKLECLPGNSISHLPMLQEVNLNSLQRVSDGCLNYLGRVTNLSLPECTEVLRFTFSKNKLLCAINLPKVRIVGGPAIMDNPLLNQLILPSRLEGIGTTAIKGNPNLVIKNPTCVKKSNLSTILKKIVKGRFYE